MEMALYSIQDVKTIKRLETGGCFSFFLMSIKCQRGLPQDLLSVWDQFGAAVVADVTRYCLIVSFNKLIIETLLVKMLLKIPIKKRLVVELV